ncbi:protein kinase domain-containing protein [Streptosporangium sp. CA-115845]|uniref:protein kinase domain-containing protein n=1 Tax=Streptosporangium sp. CA-115845 TaxID=3240071 RepID=UPI003D8B4A08
MRSGEPVRIGSYRLIARLGEGGQGVVYLGETGDATRVAIKVLHARLVDDPSARRRFLREVEAAMKVAPFCTARVLEAALTADQPYVVSEYIDGEPLNRLVQSRGPLGADDLRRLAVGTAAALLAIHRVGIVHRDFKPSNVIIGSDGPRVVDFGIARALDMTTTTSSVLGTPPYMSPEQFGEGEVDTPSDVFSWGSTMVYAATGSPPFGHGHLAVMFNRITKGRPELDGVPAELHDLLVSCLDKRPGKRPTARSLLEALTRLGGSETDMGSVVLARGEQHPESRRRSGRALKVGVSVGAGLAVMATVLGLTVLWDGGTEDSATPNDGSGQTINAVAVAGSTVVAAGGGPARPDPLFLYSDDGGGRWSYGEVSNPSQRGRSVNQVAGVPGRWLAVGPGPAGAVPNMWTSADGRTWAEADPGSAFQRGDVINDVAVTGSGFVAVGSTQPGKNPRAWHSADGRVWNRTEAASPGKVGEFRTVVTREDVVVALADGLGEATTVIVRSNDGGRSWLRTGAALPGVRPETAALATTDEGLLLVSTQRAGTGEARVFCSEAGANWVRCGVIKGLGPQGVYGVVSAPGGAIAIAPTKEQQYALYRSANGKSWSKSDDLGRIPGTLSSLAVTEAGTVVAGGGERTQEGVDRAVLVTALSGGDARRIPLQDIADVARSAEPSKKANQ